MKELIYIIDDEPDILELVAVNLHTENFSTMTFEKGSDFLAQIELAKPSLIILDLMLPDMNGIELCKELNSNPNYSMIPIIILTAKETETDKVLGLELGADDYITKPFSSKELCARVKAVLRRSRNKKDSFSNVIPSENKEGTTDHIINYKDILFINTKTYETKVHDTTISLTSTQFRILLKLLENPNWVVSRKELLQNLWEDTKLVSDRTIDVHIKHLRDKLGNVGEKIINIRGVGYKIENS